MFMSGLLLAFGSFCARSLCTIHGAVNVIPGVDDVSQIVLQNRGQMI